MVNQTSNYSISTRSALNWPHHQIPNTSISAQSTVPSMTLSLRSLESEHCIVLAQPFLCAAFQTLQNLSRSTLSRTINPLGQRRSSFLVILWLIFFALSLLHYRKQPLLRSGSAICSSCDENLKVPNLLFNVVRLQIVYSFCKVLSC